MASKAAQEAFKLKWHRARMYEQGMSRAAVQRKIGQMQAQKKLPQGAILSNSDVPKQFRSKPKKDGRSPYRRWADQEWNNTKSGTRIAAPDNGKSPWRNFVQGGGAKKVKDALDLGHAERQARYAANKRNKSGVSDEAVRRRLAAMRKGKKANA